jgi:tetratricopeptide (TPR) repeat protein
MREPLTRAAGLVLVAGYAAFLGWLFAIQPKTMAEAVGGVVAGLGAYAVDSQAFSDGLSYFRNDQFAEARTAFARADPARRDARTQFYIAYSFYREGWHRTHRDDGLYQQGLAAVERAIEVAPGGRLVVDDANLQMHSADELKVELARGLGASVSDLNPLRLLESRK